MQRSGRTRKLSRNKVRSLRAFEHLEGRTLFAAHIVGDPTVYATIQAAVNAAAPGAIINVDAGTYTETVTINKQLILRGAEFGIDARAAGRGIAAKESIITGPNTGNGNDAAFYISANDVTLDGFTVQNENNGNNVATGAGIVMAPNIAGTHVLDNIVQNNVSGLFLSNSSATDAAVIQHNLFQNNNNAGTNGGRGIYTDGSIFGATLTNVTIDQNSFINNHGSTGTTGAEAAVAIEAANPGKQSSIRITNNIFQDNGKAVLFFNATNIVIEGNTITGQIDSAGTLRFEGGDTNVIIEYNTIDNNGGTGVGIDSKGVPYADSGFTIEFNNFFNNSTDWKDKLSVIANDLNYTGTLQAINNWWGDASGPGGDGTGTGDTIYGNGNYIAGHQWAELAGGSVVFSPWATTAFVAPTIPAAPTGLAASVTAALPPAVNPQVVLSWHAATGSPTGYELDRSTDGINFSTYAILPSSMTTYTDTNVVSSAAYSYRVSASNVAGNSPYSAVVSVVTPSAPVVNLSSLSWVTATTGWSTVKKDLSINGNPLTLRGTTYATGIGTHAASTIVYNLGGNYATFKSDVGIDDEVAGKGSVDFQVIGDGTVLYDSGILTGASPVAHINVSVAGVQQLTLVATNGIPGNIDYDHSDWAGAQLFAATVAPTIPTAPTNLAATAASASQINLTWTNTATNQTIVKIERSTDGTNYTVVNTVSATATSYADNTVAANQNYYYDVVATNSAGDSPASNAVSATTPAANVFLSDLTPVSATSGWLTVQDDLSIDGNPLTLRGTTYADGIGAHALSTIVYNLAGGYSSFTSDAGIDDEVAGKGEVDFQVIGDGTVLYDSGILTGSSPVAHINVSVAGVQQLTLLATNGIPGDIDFDHADWAGAQLLITNLAPTLPSAPTNLAAATGSAGQVHLTWTNTAVNQTGVKVERSTDEINYTLVTTLGAGATSYTDVGLNPKTSYTYVVLATNSAGDSVVSNAETATTLPAANVYLSDLTPLSAVAGWGTVQEDQTIAGNSLTLRGTTYSKGIGTHASSTIVYNLNGNYSTFVADVGVDDETAGNGAVDFQVYGDGKLLFDSGVVTGTSAIFHISVNIVGVQQLTLQASSGVAGTIDYDHADWAGAEILG